MPEPRASLLRRLIRPRMSLRVTMGVILIVGIGLGWFITRARRQAETVEMVRRLGGEVKYDWQYRDFISSGLTQPPGPKWLVDFVGPDTFYNVTLIQFNTWPTKLDEAFVFRFGELHQLQELRFGHAPAISDAGFARLAGLTRMRRLDISETGVSGRAFVHLKGMSDLWGFYAVEVETFDSDLANLSGLTKLDTLGFQGDRLTNAGFAHLRPLKNLKNLQIISKSPMQVTSAGLAHLSGMVNLWQLVLIKSKVESLEPIRGLTSLKNLQLVDACLDDEGLSSLANLSKLETLALSGKDEKFGDDGLAHLAGLKSLDSLYLKDTKIGDAGLAHLAGLSKLETLNLDGTRVTDAGLTQLARLPKLKTLSLCRTVITDAGLAQIAGLKACREVMLEDTKTTQAGIASLRSKNPKLQVH
jgi:Leucine Rich repeat